MRRARLEHAVKVLTAMLHDDYDAISKLMALHVVANKQVCDKHRVYLQPNEHVPYTRLLGIMEVVNALCADETAYIVAVIDKKERLNGFKIERLGKQHK